MGGDGDVGGGEVGGGEEEAGDGEDEVGDGVGDGEVGGDGRRRQDTGVWQEEAGVPLCLLPSALTVVVLSQVNLEEMIPKPGKSPADSRKSVGIHEFAALARSSLNGNKAARLVPDPGGAPEASSVSHRYLPGRQRPCDQAHLPGPGPGRPPDRVERMAEAQRAAAQRSRPLQLLLPPDRRREGGALRCRCPPPSRAALPVWPPGLTLPQRDPGGPGPPSRL